MNLEKMGKVEVDCNKKESVANKPSQSPESAYFFFGSILHVKSTYSEHTTSVGCLATLTFGQRSADTHNVFQ